MDGETEARGLDLGLPHQELYFSDSSAAFSLMLLSQRVSLPSALKVTMLFQGFLEELMLGAVLGPWGWVSPCITVLTCSLMGTGTSRPWFSVWIRMKGLV